MTQSDRLGRRGPERCEDVSERLGPADAFAVPRDRRFELAEGSADLAWLEVTLPAQVSYTPVR